MNAAAIELESEKAANAWAENVCAWLVLAGLVIEVGYAVWFRDPGTSLVKTWTPVLADALVAIGVFGELHFAGKITKSEDDLRRKSEERVATAELKAAEAYERAAQLEKFTGWRSISPEGAKRIGNVIKSLGVGIRLGIATIQHDAEAANFMYSIAGCFHKVRVKSFDSSILQPSFSRPFGVYLCTSDDVNEFKIASAFFAEGTHVECSLLDFSSIFPSSNGGPNVCFFVASKPSPGHGFRTYPPADQMTQERIRPVAKFERDGRVVR